MDLDYGQRYRQLYEHHWWWRAREAFVIDVLERHAPASGFGEVLDVGCGDGLFLDGLDRFGTARGLELDARLVSEARAHRIHLGPLDARYSPETQFGLVTMLDVLEHIDDDAAALEQVRRVLEPGGTLVVTVPAFAALWTHHDTVNHHHRRYRRAQLAERVTDAGFVVQEARYFFHWTVPAKLLVRGIEALRGPGEAVERVPSAPINAALQALSRAERRLWGRLPLPGSSLLLVARG